VTRRRALTRHRSVRHAARSATMVDIEEILVLEGRRPSAGGVGRLRDGGLVSQLRGLVGTTRTFRRARALLK
jgi:hypothetical protein